MDKTLLIERAKTYLKTLSEGVNPVTGRLIPPEAGLNDEKIIKCFSFINETLDDYLKLSAKVEKLESERGKSTVVLLKKEKFAITKEQCDEIKLSLKPVTMMAFMNNVNSVIDSSAMEKLTPSRVNKWLVERGFLRQAKVQTVINKTVFRPCEEALRLGMTEVEAVDAKSGEIKKQLVLDEKA